MHVCVRTCIPYPYAKKHAHALEAKKILKNLQEHGHESAHNLLSERLSECEAASRLKDDELGNMALKDVQGLVNIARPLWALFPVQLQLKLCSYFATVHLKALAKCNHRSEVALSTWPPADLQHVDDLVTCLALCPCESQLIEMKTFDGANIIFGNTLFLTLALLDDDNPASQENSTDDMMFDVDEVLPTPNVKEKDALDHKQQLLKTALED